jgi:CheY-like chemotaxis protein
MAKLILVVDDDDLIRRILRQHLETLNYRVIEAENGLEAIKAIETGEADGMFLDIRMPVSDGIEVLVWLKNKASTLPVVVFTQADENSRHSYRTIAEQFGAIKAFSKPISKESVHEAVALLESAMSA